MKKQLKHLFKWREEMSVNFYVADLFFRKLLRHNASTPWAVHFTSTVHCPQNIKKGINVFPGDSPGSYIEASNGIEIGDYTNLGPNVGLISSNHNHVNNMIHDPAPPIRIGRFCWIGMNAVILPGVEIGDFTIVGAGAIVTKSFMEGYCVLGGSPAEIINHLDQDACKKFSETR